MKSEGNYLVGFTVILEYLVIYLGGGIHFICEIGGGEFYAIFLLLMDDSKSGFSQFFHPLGMGDGLPPKFCCAIETDVN